MKKARNSASPSLLQSSIEESEHLPTGTGRGAALLQSSIEESEQGGQSIGYNVGDVTIVHRGI